MIINNLLSHVADVPLRDTPLLSQWYIDIRCVLNICILSQILLYLRFQFQDFDNLALLLYLS